MSKVSEYRANLQTMDEWNSYLFGRSGLPRPGEISNWLKRLRMRVMLKYFCAI